MLQFGASRNFFLQGKTKEDVRKSKEGYGQLLLAMFSVFLKVEEGGGRRRKEEEGGGREGREGEENVKRGR